MDIDSGGTRNNISFQDMNASLPSTRNRPTARSEMVLCSNQQEMASFTSFVSASRSAGVGEVGSSLASSSYPLVPHTPLPENLTKRFEKLSLRTTSDSTSALDDDDDDDDDHRDDPSDDDGTAHEVICSSDVDMVEEIADDDDERVSSHRSKFDRIRLDEYRAHLVDTASEAIQSFYETCHVRLDSANNNSNIDSMPAVLTTSFPLDIPYSGMYPHEDFGIILPISTGYHLLGHSEKPVQPSTQNDLEKKRPRKRVSFTSAPSIKWFRKEDRIEIPTRRKGKNPLVAVLRHLVSSQKYRQETACKLKVIPILKKRYKRLKA